MKDRQFANCFAIIDELPDGGDDGPANIVAVANDSKSTAEIFAALLLGNLIVITISCILGTGMVMGGMLTRRFRL